MSDFRDWLGIPRRQPGQRFTENDNAGQPNTMSLWDQAQQRNSSAGVGGMNNWGRKNDPYGTRLPQHIYPTPEPNNDPHPRGVVTPLRTGLLADAPLPPGGDGSDLPGPRVMPSTPRHAYGRPSYAEGETMPLPPGQFNIRQLNEALGGPEMHSSEDVADIAKRPLPPEYQPQREIPLGELQRRFGVPRLEDL